MSLAGAILVGGQSRRMGRDKALLDVQGQPLLARVLAVVEQVAQDCFLVADQAAPYAFLGLPIYPDYRPGCGAIGGLYTALERTAHPYTLVVACDMPWLNLPLLQAMAALTDFAPADPPAAIVPRWQGQPEPLHAIYHHTCRPRLAQQIEVGDLKIAHLFQYVAVRYVEEVEIARYDPTGRSFTNLNTPADLAAADLA